MYIGATALFNGMGYTRAGGGQIWLDNIACRGTEGRILGCSLVRLGAQGTAVDCTHTEDSGIRCRTDSMLHGIMYAA